MRGRERAVLADVLHLPSVAVLDPVASGDWEAPVVLAGDDEVSGACVRAVVQTRLDSRVLAGEAVGSDPLVQLADDLAVGR